MEDTQQTRGQTKGFFVSLMMAVGAGTVGWVREMRNLDRAFPSDEASTTVLVLSAVFIGFALLLTIAMRIRATPYVLATAALTCLSVWLQPIQSINPMGNAVVALTLGCIVTALAALPGIRREQASMYDDA